MLYLIEKYSKTSIPGLPKYDPSKDYLAGSSSMSAIEQSP